MEELETVRKKKEFNPMQPIVLAFVLIIFLGACLLDLPAASRDGKSAGFFTALFTAVTSVCVTGLTVVDTWTQWSGFGQVILLILLELGGLGFMSAAALISIFFRRRFSMKQRMVMAQMLSLEDIGDILEQQHWVLRISLILQGAGAAILALRFLPTYGLKNALWMGLFHSVAAFCNGGLDLFGRVEPGIGLAPVADDPVVLFTLMILIVSGGLGFLVLRQFRPGGEKKRLDLYMLLVLIMTAGLILGGTVCFALIEWNNPETLGLMPVPQKLLNALFQSVTCRSAGMSTYSQLGLTDSSRAIVIALMLIGGSSNSTAGGIKTVTLAVIILYLRSILRSRSKLVVRGRNIPDQVVLDAMTITGLISLICVFGGFFIEHTSHIGLGNALFMSASALSASGLGLISVPTLSLSSQILLMAYMFFGRVGVLTLSMSFFMKNRAEERITYPDAKLMIG